MKNSFYEVKPVEGFRCSISVPGSKSITNRALIAGALARGKTLVKNVLFSDDTIYMIEALTTLGIPITVDKGRGTVEIEGKENTELMGKCFVGNAGTVMRFLPSFIAVKGGEVELHGEERMKERPIGELVDVLRQLGADISYPEREGYPPIRVKASGLKGGKISMKGSTSSQFISSVLLCAPYCKADVYLNIEEEPVSRPYIDITMGVMQDFGVEVENCLYRSFFIRAGQKYMGREYTVESDCSSASYFFAAAAIAGGDVTVENINPDSLQGDIRFVDIIEKMGAKVERGRDFIRVSAGKLKGISIDMNDIPDMAQTLAVISLFADGPTEIRNVFNLRLKETDRLRALTNELAKLGAEVEEKEDGLAIYPSSDYKAADIDTYNDHRMAMSFAIAGLKISGVRISNPGCVSKTFPGFFQELEKLYDF